MKKITALLLAICLCLALCACGGSTAGEPAATEAPSKIEAPVETEAPAETEAPSETEVPAEPDTELPINIMVLNGTTGFGMAKLIDSAASGEAALNYSFSVETDASNITAALINGSADIAALPTNAASTLYNKTSGKVQLLALNTRGVLYLVVNGEAEINSISDLAGKTVYAPAQNPTFIFNYLCKANGLEPGTDIVIDNSYAQPADLRTAIASGEVEFAVLPEPMVTMACAANQSLVVALDLTEEWDAVSPEGSLVQGCVVVRTEFAAEHPAELAKFLEEYDASVAYLSEDPEGAATAVESTGIFANGAVALKAIPKCNVCFVTGEEMKAAMSEFLNVMFEVAPESIGGAVPADGFYYIG